MKRRIRDLFVILTAISISAILPESKAAADGRTEEEFRPVRRGLVANAIFYPPDFVVTSIDLSDEPTAVVNGETLKAGDRLEGVTVLKIEEGLVEFSSDGNYFIKLLKRTQDPSQK